MLEVRDFHQMNPNSSRWWADLKSSLTHSNLKYFEIKIYRNIMWLNLESQLSLKSQINERWLSDQIQNLCYCVMIQYKTCQKHWVWYCYCYYWCLVLYLSHFHSSMLEMEAHDKTNTSTWPLFGIVFENSVPYLKIDSEIFKLNHKLNHTNSNQIFMVQIEYLNGSNRDFIFKSQIWLVFTHHWFDSWCYAHESLAASRKASSLSCSVRHRSAALHMGLSEPS